MAGGAARRERHRSGGFRAPLIVALGLLGGWGAARADGSGLQLRHLLSPEPGKVQALIEPDSTVALSGAAAADFALLLNGGQPARNVTVRKNSDRGGLLTLVVLDDSGSYRNKAGTVLARPLLQGYVSALGPNDRIGLVVFGTDAKAYPIRTSGTDFLADLADPQRQSAAGRANLRATNLLSGLSAALGVLRKEQEEKRVQPGLAEIILLTDAGDEAGVDTSDWRSVLTDSEARGVRVSAIISDMATSAGAAQRLASLTRLRELSEKTYGLYDNSNSVVSALSTLRTARDRQKSWLTVEAELCGIAAASGSGPPQTDARVEYAPGGARQAWSGARSFRPQWTPASAAPCPSLIPCSPSCRLWEQCTAGTCEPRACTANEQCGPTARCVAQRCERVADPQPLWLWALLGGLLVLLGGLATFLLLRKRRSDGQEAKKPEEPMLPPVEPPLKPADPPAVVPVAVAGAGAAAVAPLLDPLPETHLVAIGGRVNIGEKWRLHKAKVYVGGSSAPEDGNDIVFSLPQVSTKHALFESYPSGALWLTDLKARNGTYLNGRKLEPGERVALKPGDQVKLSQQLILEVQRPGAGKAAAEPEAPSLSPPQADEKAPQADEKAPARVPLDKKKTVFDPGNR